MTTISKFYSAAYGTPLVSCICYDGPPAVLGDIWSINGASYTVIESPRDGEVVFDRPLERSIPEGSKVQITTPDSLPFTTPPVLKTRPFPDKEKLRRDLVAAGYVEGPDNVFTKQGGGERATIEFMGDGVKIKTEILCGVRILEPIDPSEFYDEDLGEPHAS